MEGVEADAGREEDAEGDERVLHAHRGEHGGGVLDEEVEVLEVAEEEEEVAAERDTQHELLVGGVRPHPEAADVVDDGGQVEQPEEPDVDPPVEDGARDGEHPVLPLAVRPRPMQREDDGEEPEELGLDEERVALAVFETP